MSDFRLGAQTLDVELTPRIRHKHSTSVFIALMREREVLLLRRKGTGWMDGSFSLPAGALDAGETISMAAIREAREEVGVRIDPAHLMYAHTLHSRTDGSDWVGHFFTASTWDGTPELREPDKHSDLAWWPIDKLPLETIPYVRQVLLCVERRQPYSEFGWLSPHGTT